MNEQTKETPSGSDNLNSLVGGWKTGDEKPDFWEQRVLLVLDLPFYGGMKPQTVIGWWKHGPMCFAWDDLENCDHLVLFWMQIPEIPSNDLHELPRGSTNK